VEVERWVSAMVFPALALTVFPGLGLILGTESWCAIRVVVEVVASQVLSPEVEMMARLAVV
jgi:hypothetical protein